MNTAGMEKEKPNQRPSQMKATDMKARHMDLTRHCCTVLTALAISAGIAAVAPYALAQTVTCDETVLSVNATDIKAEDLIKAIGNECGIKMVLRGKLFTEDVFSVRFENMPIRKGLARILRVVNIPNHMMHFAETDNQNHVIEVDLIGEKGGERELTPGATNHTPQSAQAQTEKLLDDTEKTGLEQQQEEVQQEKVMELLEEILDTQVENGTEPDPAEVREMLQQALPPEMQGQIPEEVLEELEQLTEE
jgi:hypothetical protein